MIPPGLLMLRLYNLRVAGSGNQYWGFICLLFVVEYIISAITLHFRKSCNHGAHSLSRDHGKRLDFIGSFSVTTAANVDFFPPAGYENRQKGLVTL